ncbi:MAG TPA: hypothetical protein VHM30_09340, partial [Gemmatimonadaceae bacterium]|nr:hypothetical protein [Gemmatimonadaceae bacterium]
MLLALAFAASAPAGAQEGGYIPLDDPAMPTIDALVARGALPRLSSLERPYRAADLRDAVDSVLNQSHWGNTPFAPHRWYRIARGAAARYGGGIGRDEVVVLASVTPFVTAQSSGGRELMLADTLGGIYPGMHLRLGA